MLDLIVSEMFRWVCGFVNFFIDNWDNNDCLPSFSHKPAFLDYDAFYFIVYLKLYIIPTGVYRVGAQGV